jgi:hypothetical protein
VLSSIPSTDQKDQFPHDLARKAASYHFSAVEQDLISVAAVSLTNSEPRASSS